MGADMSNPGVAEGDAPIFVVQITIDPDREDEWNHWYDSVHVPEVMAASPAILSATRYRLSAGNIPHRYLAVYRFRDEAGLEAFMGSPELAQMSSDYTRDWGAVSDRVRGAFTPILHREA